VQCVRVLIYIKTIINKLGQKSRVVRPFRQLWTTAGSGRGYGGHVGGHVRTRVTRVCSRAEVNSASRKTSVDNHTHTHTHTYREREREREREKRRKECLVFSVMPKTHGIENRRRFSERVSSENQTPWRKRLRFLTSIRTGSVQRCILPEPVT